MKKSLLLLFSLPYLALAQPGELDSLENIMREAKVDTVKADLLNKLSRQLITIGQYDKALNFSSQAMALLAAHKGNERGVKIMTATTFNNLGILYRMKGNYGKSLENNYQALRIRLAENDKPGIAASYNNIGSVFKERADLPRALDNYLKSLEIFKEIGDKKRIAASLNNIGTVYYDMNNDALSLEFYYKSVEIKKEIGDRAGMTGTLNNIGNIYFAKGKLDSAMAIYKRTLAIVEELGDKEGIAAACTNLGSLHTKMRKFKDARQYLDRATQIASEQSFKASMKHTLEKMVCLDTTEGDFRKGLKHFDLYIDYRDSILNQANLEKSVRAELDFEYEKKQAQEKLEQERKDLQADAELNRQKQQRNYSIAGLVLVFLLALLIFRSFREKQRANVSLAEKNKIIEDKNKDITDSINYAKKIQEALFSEKELKYSLFPNAFVLFQPRDVVSGDFYWFAKKGGKRFIAAVDCTGHGVPGAFMSLIGNDFLNEVVNERGITRPETILSELRHMVIRSLKQTGDSVEAKDGMDIALIAFDDANGTVEFAGANNPLWVVRRNDKQQTTNYELIEYEAAKRPIGYFMGQSHPFIGHKLEMKAGDTYYIFSDGYADQFGGPKGKKFKYKPLKELLLSIQELPMEEQEAVLLKAFNDWKGTLDQVDDVLVIGVKV